LHGLGISRVAVTYREGEKVLRERAWHSQIRHIEYFKEATGQVWFPFDEGGHALRHAHGTTPTTRLHFD